MLHRASTAALAVLLGAACADPTSGTDPLQSKASAPGNELTLARLRPEPYSFAYYSGMTDSAQIVVRSQAEWEQVWARIHSRQSPVPAVPRIDFEHETVAVAALGQRPSGGFSIYVDSAYQRAGYVEIVVSRVMAGARCTVTGALTQPVDLARISAANQPVRFRERSSIDDCS